MGLLKKHKDISLGKTQTQLYQVEPWLLDKVAKLLDNELKEMNIDGAEEI